MDQKYEPVRNDIRAILKKDGYDDGHIGPVLVRLGWHASGTYDSKSKSGGSNGATMRFKPESTDGANAGLEHARAFLEPIKQKHPWISYADLWTLSACVAIEAMNGPKIPWKGGRSDVNPKAAQAQPAKVIPPNGRLPDAAQGASHVRDIFYRMGFNDQEIVALSGAHSLGRCHTDRSGFSGPWTHTPTRFSNQYFILLSTLEWKEKKWDGPKQYVDEDDELMMLPSDMALIWDPKFKVFVDLYAKDKEAFYRDFAMAFAKLLELGVTRQKI
ncbi:heme peroxidase [Globomyces pollinis-pini]|nr:heme peroxidase [Globomyces pollinis-pini]